MPQSKEAEARADGGCQSRSLPIGLKVARFPLAYKPKLFVC
jgi:hypothetical protein